MGASGGKDKPWTAASMGDQSGKVVVVTGASSGLGLATAAEFAARGATVVLACRDAAKAARAAAAVQARAAGGGRAVTMALDLGDLASVRRFAADAARDLPRIDVLVNNAGVMVPPEGRTKDGFETQLGTNHLGHFALTALLWPLLRRSAPCRVVNVSSLGAHNRPPTWAAMRFDDPHFEKGYDAWGAYGQSKLANLLFTYELHRRAAGCGVTVAAAHPGFTSTELQRTSAFRFFKWFTPAWMQPEQGALPQLRAAADPALAAGGVFLGPDSRGESRGYPVPAKVPPRALDEAAARRLWELSERETGCSFDLPAAPRL